WVADVTRCDVVPRREVPTPWAPRDPDEPQVMYWLGPLERRELPIVNRHGERLSSHRWSSVLALGRARELRELLLETEPEWRLYETLRAHRADVELEPGPARLVDSEDPAGRTWLVVDGRRARHDGGARFVLDGPDRPPGTTHDLAAACGYLLGPDLRP
ncbi:MAG TPA: hypothetical protein VGC42_27875, partial [Kofleriaceae bacterium]